MRKHYTQPVWNVSAMRLGLDLREFWEIGGLIFDSSKSGKRDWIGRLAGYAVFTTMAWPFRLWMTMRPGFRRSSLTNRVTPAQVR